MFMLSDVLMNALFVRGEFSQHDALMSGIALKSMAGGILGFMLIKIFAPAFFAGQDTKTPVKIGIVAVFANMIFSVIFIGLFYLFKLPLHGGLALATTAASFVNAGLLYYFCISAASGALAVIGARWVHSLAYLALPWRSLYISSYPTIQPTVRSGCVCWHYLASAHLARQSMARYCSVQAFAQDS